MILETENYNAILTEKQQKYIHYYQIKSINVNILHVKKSHHRNQITEEAKFTYSLLKKKKKTKKKKNKKEKKKKKKKNKY